MSRSPPRRTHWRVIVFLARLHRNQTHEEVVLCLHGLKGLYHSIYSETGTRSMYHIFAD